MKGYIQGRISEKFQELLEPMNSYLRGHGIATYDGDSKQFRYAPFKRVTKEGDYSISYTKVPGMSKDDRTKHLSGFELYKDMSMNQLVKLVSTDTIFSNFKVFRLDTAISFVSISKLVLENLIFVSFATGTETLTGTTTIGLGSGMTGFFSFLNI